MKKATILFVLLYSITACSPIMYSGNPETNYTALGYSQRIESDTIPIFLAFVGEPLDFEYRKLGIVELTGNHSNEIVFENLMYQAWKKGGNSVLLIKKEQVQYDYLTNTDGNGGSTYTPLYVSHWTGFVAEIPDSIYREKIVHQTETKYAKSVEDKEYSERKNNRGSSAVFSILMLGLLGSLPFILS